MVVGVVDGTEVGVDVGAKVGFNVGVGEGAKTTVILVLDGAAVGSMVGLTA